eukprot:NODE_19_length_2774_cov_108.968644_g18_i0.p1 GENE.NODE_19_length_2774_cov_108.968644_g18_i0~~NODE_19_length_2774_cov_108.968644_g18_i0.p1  ORF type:complete len:859 (-),score=229.78 NODE_19_length_2774_cov_108.968644_g18_i0:196-2703(-)
MSEQNVIRLRPNQYIHILDNNTNVTRLEVGPHTFTRKDHERVVVTPQPFMNVPPRSYCRIRNPVLRNEDGTPVKDKFEQVQRRIGDEEIRFEQDPFPLYPGEEIVLQDGKKVAQLKVVEKNTGLLLRAKRDGQVGDRKFLAGEEWMFVGPGTYQPRVDVEEVARITATVINPNEALKLRAKVECTDKNGVKRQVGEAWLIKAAGAYLPQVEEEVVGKVKARILTDQKALQLEATRTFVDRFGKKRLAGSQWLVTSADCSSLIPDVYENVVREVPITTLTDRHWCLVVDPVDPKTLLPRLGHREIRKGEASFFLHPGERLEGGIQNVIVLTAEEALLLRASCPFTDAKGEKRNAGDTWMLFGACKYVPPVEVEIVERRRSMALDKHEGVYVRDITTGKIRSIIGQAYMLSPTEELWEKDLPPIVEELLQRPTGCKHAIKDSAQPLKPRDRTKVVRFSVQHNAAVQIYDYSAHTARIVFGPDLVMLGPDEQFTVFSISGDKPKTPNIIKALPLYLGPDFMTDYIQVETSDHARLQLKLSYNWRFEIDEENKTKIFSLPDFVGAACASLASKVRGAVAAEAFESFHQNSARVIRCAVFGVDAEGHVLEKVTFPANGLSITNVDIQNVEPTDQKTKDSLQKSVQQSIEITTKSQEAAARHDANRKEQEAKGRLERQVIKDKVNAESSRKSYLQLQAETEEIEAAGTAKAEATARAEAAFIDGQSELAQAKLKAEAAKITHEAELAQLKSKQQTEADYQRKMNELDVNKARELAEIESKKFADTVDSIGQETLQSIAQAGPEMQAKLLEGLGLKGYLITDGSSPINLFNTAKGLVGPTSM